MYSVTVIKKMDQYCYRAFLTNPILVLGSAKRLVRKGMARLILI